MKRRGRDAPRGSMWPALLLVAVGLAAGGNACSGGESGSAGNAADAARDTLTRRQKDSILGESPLPGARGVRGALRAADSVNARYRRLDSLGGVP
ncbi:MAG: hypothetical protein ACE5HP_02835 [Gemmatimonadota bacterium]